MSSDSTFWGQNPCILFQSLSLIPNDTMTKDEKLNALTRLSLIASAVLYAMNYPQWNLFLIGSICIIILIHVSQNKDREGFTITPRYRDADFRQTVVAPVFAEERQLLPPTYSSVESLVALEDEPRQRPMRPQNYPYGQYLSKTNLLPSDEYATHMMNGGAVQAKNYANSAFLRHRLAFQDNMMRIHRKKIARRFKHTNCLNDTVSPFNSF